MLVLGIDPGSTVTGWGLLKFEGNKIHYVASGVLRFSKEEFLCRLTDIREQSHRLIDELNPDEVALESLIYVKSPTALIKLAQTRGVILSNLVQNYKGRIFEYSPNLIKSSTVGHGHADKKSVMKTLDLLLGKREYETHDESDALAVAMCHILNRNSRAQTKTVAKSRGMSASLSHKFKIAK